LTPKTIASKRELERLRASVRRERLAISHEDTIDERVTRLAAPVLDEAGDILAGLVIGAPTSRTLSRGGAAAPRPSRSRG
jgi:DNA-binding IclR family transcriptional regulator